MKNKIGFARNRMFQVLVPALMACLAACGNKSDPAANAGGGSSVQRNVVTMKGDAQ